MSTSTTITIYYADTQLAPAILDKIRHAKSSIQMMVYLWKTGYAQRTVADDILDAVIARKQELPELEVYVLFNYARFDSYVASENRKTAEKLAGAGCAVRMGPRNQTLHTKMSIFDLTDVFIGSHNYTRSGLGFNGEATVFTNTKRGALWSTKYYTIKWLRSTRLSDTPPDDTTYVPVEIRLDTARTVGEEIELAFTVNNTNEVDAFSAVSDSELNLDGANMGATVAPDARVARVTPLVAAGQEVYLAVRAYRAGTVEAESNVYSMVYLPAEAPGDGGDDGGGGEPPPPEPLTAPTVTGITQASPTTVTVDWTFVGAPNFQRIDIEQRDVQLQWQEIGVVIDASTREWTGAPHTMDYLNPFRVVVYNTASQSATSNEVLLTQPALTAPQLESVVAGLNGTEITATWTFAGCANFHRFEIQKMVGTDWSVVGSTLDPSVRQWVGPGPGVGFTEATYRIVVFNMAEESAASNEITITGEPPVSLTAPVLVSVTQIGPMGINVEYSHVTPADFARYEVQQRTNETWNTLATITTPETRSWSGGPVPYMDAQHPVRVVVFVQSGDSAASNEMAITPM